MVWLIFMLVSLLLHPIRFFKERKQSKKEFNKSGHPRVWVNFNQDRINTELDDATSLMLLLTMRGETVTVEPTEHGGYRAIVGDRVYHGRNHLEALQQAWDDSGPEPAA
jgi:hypothetical protein